MMLPDFSQLDRAGLTRWGGGLAPAAEAARSHGLRFLPADLGDVADKSQLLQTLAKSLQLPPYFGRNWDALADCIEDDDWIGPSGSVILVAHSQAYRKDHPADWAVLEGIFTDAADYWREKRKPLWILVD